MNTGSTCEALTDLLNSSMASLIVCAASADNKDSPQLTQ